MATSAAIARTKPTFAADKIDRASGVTEGDGNGLATDMAVSSERARKNYAAAEAIGFAQDQTPS
jgi:hypothetical protein